MKPSEQKVKIKKLMIDHLKSKGYPNMTSKAILAELKPMWIMLEEAGLVNSNWKYTQFVNIAEAQAHYQNLKEAMSDELSTLFKKRPR